MHFLNEEIVQGVFEPELSEIHYKADPAHLLDPVEIDLAKLPSGTKNMYVKDLKLEEKGVNVSTPADFVTQLFHRNTDKNLKKENDHRHFFLFLFLFFILYAILFIFPFPLQNHIPGIPDIIHQS